MKSSTKKVIECPVCGENTLELRARPGRMISHRLMQIEIPADFELPECSACGARPMDWKTAEKLNPLLEAGYQTELQKLVAADLDVLVEFKPLFEWERELGLSVGYLSKVRNEKAPSAQLVALVRLLANEPTRRRELHDLWARRKTDSIASSMQIVGGVVSSIPPRRVPMRVVHGELHISERKEVQ